MKLSNHKPWFPSEWPTKLPHKSTILFIVFILIYSLSLPTNADAFIKEKVASTSQPMHEPTVAIHQATLITCSTIGSLEKDIAVKEMPHQIRQEEQSMRQTSLPSIQFRTIDVNKQYRCHQYNYRSPGQKDVDHS